MDARKQYEQKRTNLSPDDEQIIELFRNGEKKKKEKRSHVLEKRMQRKGQTHVK